MQNTTFSQTDDFPYLVENVLISISLAVIFFINISVNSGILVFLWKNEHLHVATNAIVAAISGNDLLIAVSCVLAQWVSSCFRDLVFNDLFSYITAFFSSFCRTFGAVCVTFLAVVRCLSLRDFSWTGPRNTTVYLFLLSTALVSVAGAIPWYLIFDEQAIPYGDNANVTTEYDIERCIYSCHRVHWISYQTAVCRLIPLTLALFSCIKIIITSAKIKMKLNSSFGTNDEIKIFAETGHAMTVVFLVFVHLVCQLPLCMNEMFMWTLMKDNGVFLVHPSLAVLSWLNSAINPVIYLVRSPKLPSLIQNGKCCLPLLGRNRTYATSRSSVNKTSTSESLDIRNARLSSIRTGYSIKM